MPVISLLTDFGLKDPYVGIMKGVILSICPEAVIIDISHGIAPQDVYVAAFTLESAFPYFPEGTVNVAVVDPGVGSSRGIAAVKTESLVFIAPDNGLLTPVLDTLKVVEARLIENPEIFLQPPGSTFHGRDIFAPAAARLACGVKMEKLGPEIDPGMLVRLDICTGPVRNEQGRLYGSIIAVDRFGNLITNIKLSDIKEEFGSGGSSEGRIFIQAGKRVIAGISSSYSSVPEGSPLAIIGSTGRMEISVNSGNAGKLLGMGRGDIVEIFGH